jgi:hypothetical protein
MKRVILSILIVALLGFGAWYLYRKQPGAVAPAITITSPAAGDTWQAGETREITWSTQGVPADDKISITLRRIPPPPLPEEGQEFDPIVFTDLPNTGSTTWKIATMYPGGTYVLGLGAYASVPVTNAVSAESQPFTITHPKLAIDLYPLYSGATWERSAVEDATVGTTTYSGASMVSAPQNADMDPGAVFTPFLNYYDTLLASHGWHVADDLAAGGHVGGQTGYRNGPGIILVGFHIDYQNQPENAPSECPCSVTLSLFSSGATN